MTTPIIEMRAIEKVLPARTFHASAASNLR